MEYYIVKKCLTSFRNSILFRSAKIVEPKNHKIPVFVIWCLLDLAPNDPMCCAPGIRLFILELSCTILSLIIWIHWQSAVCLHERILLHLYTALVQFAVCKERDNIFVSAFLRWELIYLWNSDYKFLHDNFTKWFIDIVCETKLWAYINVYSQDDYIDRDYKVSFSL